ncbi:MAG: DUF488 family protein [Bacteroidaceae bacterium]|nr:DUF488 family protein [Bacteroidaceae bacterium]
MTIRKATIDDLPRILELRDLARGIMRRDGNLLQWPEGYPVDAAFRRDIDEGHSYVVKQGKELIATFAFIPGPDPTYSIIYDGQWLDDTSPYYVVHRIASTLDSHGVMDCLLQFCFSRTNNIRIDTHRDNHIMRRALQRHGFTYCGIIHLANGDERVAYQRIERQELYTIGHSNHSLDEFLTLIRRHCINCIVDVRSVPASTHTPQFNQNELIWFLKQHDVQYLHFGNEFGARRTDCLDSEGLVNFERAINTPAFQKGVERIQHGLLMGYRIALMCSEANPLECHRFSLISRFFHEQGINVLHILKDGKLAAHEMLEKEMIDELLHSKKHLLAEVDQLFGSYTAKEQRRDAYRQKNQEIGFRIQQNNEID